MNVPYKICFLGYGKLTEIGRKVVNGLTWSDTQITVSDCNVDNLVSCVQEATAQGCEVFVGGSANAAEFFRSVHGHLIRLKIEDTDYLTAIEKALQLGSKPAIAVYEYDKPPKIDWYSRLLGIDIESIIYEDGSELFTKISQSDCDVVIGASHANEIAEGLNKKSVLLYPGEHSITQALKAARNTAITLRQEKRTDTIFRSILNNSAFGIVISDEENKIIGFNRAASQITGITASDVRGKLLPDVIPALKTEKFIAGTERKSDEYHLIGESMFRCTQSKIILNNEVIGVLTTINSGARSRKKKSESTPMTYPAHETFHDMTSRSASMQQLIQKAVYYADSVSSIMIIGNEGTERERLAQCIHNASPCHNGPYIRINLAAIGSNDAGRLLIGSEESNGSITGRLELANGGTAVLENISEAPSQAIRCIINVMETRRITHLGSSETIHADIRFITILTPKELLALSPSLRYKLGVFEIRTLPLSERREDIPVLFSQILTRYHQFSRSRYKLSAADNTIITSYNWPGNVYELTAVCERFLQMLDHAVKPSPAARTKLLIESIGEKAIVESIKQNNAITVDSSKSDKENLQKTANDMKQLLGYNNAEIADKLGVSRTTLWRILGNKE